MKILKKLALIGMLLHGATVFAQGPERGDLIGHALLKHYTLTEIQAIYAQLSLPPFLSPIIYEIDAYKVQYWTIDAQGQSLVPASGLAMFPTGYPCGAPSVLYHHGTQFWDENLPSDLGLEILIGVPFATNGYVEVMPDYLGLGESPGRHPYVHAASEASSAIDMMRATRILGDTLNFGFNDQVFLSGYSQGGHAAMATFREMETNLSHEFSVEAVVTGGGPYDMSNTTLSSLLTPKSNLTNSYNISYVILSYQSVYGNLYDSLSQYFVSPYDTLIPLIFDRYSPLTSQQLADTAVNMFEDSVVIAVQTDSLHPLNVALRDNDVYDWAPQARLRMYYCEADEEVPYQNALVAKAAMQANGAANVDAISAGETLDHDGCVFPTFFQTKLYFDLYRENCPANAIDPALAIGLQVFPNPFQDQLRIEWEAGMDQIEEVRLLDLQGRVLRAERVRALGEVELQQLNLPAGIYVVELVGEGRYYRKVRRD
jgi:pimeloyl-ACP methyl ester carboxylesterase